MCNQRYILLAGINGRYITARQAAAHSPFQSPSMVATQRRRRWFNRFKKLPRRNGPMGRK